MKLAILKIDGTDSGEKAILKKSVFECETNNYAMYQAIRQLRANKRQGTHKSKGRSEVSGGGKKPFKQKGTGNARQGTIRAPHMKGGGRVFGPQPRKYGFRLNKSTKEIARRSAFSEKIKNGKMLIVEDFKFDVPKTKQVISILEALKIDDKRVLFLMKENDLIFYKSVYNLRYVRSVEACSVSTYDLLEAGTVVIQKGAIGHLTEVLG